MEKIYLHMQIILKEIMSTQDVEIAEIFSGELERQQYKINLIASENYAGTAVLQAQGSIMTLKDTPVKGIITDVNMLMQ